MEPEPGHTHSPPPIGEPGLAAVAATGWRTFPACMVIQPPPVLPLIASYCPRSFNRLRQTGTCPAPPPHALPGQRRRACRFPHGCPCRKLAQYQVVSPIGFHGGTMPERMPACPPPRRRTGSGSSCPCRLWAGDWMTGRGEKLGKIHFPVTFRFPVRFCAFFCVFGLSV